MIEMRRAQRSFGDGLIAEEVKDLREGWMDHADRLLDDEARAFEADSRTCAVASRLPSSNNRACSWMGQHQPARGKRMTTRRSATSGIARSVSASIPTFGFRKWSG